MINIRHVDENFIARAGSFFLFKSIEIGYGFHLLGSEEKEAVLAHERGHIFMRHTEKRILCLLFMPLAIPILNWWQELSADRYAARLGHTKVLLRILSKERKSSWLHPSDRIRRKFLKRYEQKISRGSR